MLRSRRQPGKVDRLTYRRFCYRRLTDRRLIYRRLPSVLPVNRIAAPTLVALGVFAVFGDDGSRVTSGAHQVWLAHHTPGAGPLAPDLEIRFWDPDLHVVHIQHHEVLRRILDDAIPGAAPESLAFRTITATTSPTDVSHASLGQGRESPPAALPDTSCPR